MHLKLTPDLILQAYAQGFFPMADSADSPDFHWVCPQMRGQLPIEKLHIPRRLLKTLRRKPFEIRIDSAFDTVMQRCAAATNKRPETWINKDIIEVFVKLHDLGHAHSIECWRGNELVGGVYGLKIGGAFFGESMFSRARDASKVALVHLTARLWHAGFSIFDTQFTNDHLEQFGVYEIAHENYIARLCGAITKACDFTVNGQDQDEILSAYLEMQKSHSA